MAKPDIVYSKDLAVFQNRILDLYKGMSLDEKRLLVLLSPVVRTTKIKEGSLFSCLLMSMQESVGSVTHEPMKVCQMQAKGWYEDTLAIPLTMEKDRSQLDSTINIRRGRCRCLLH